MTDTKSNEQPDEICGGTIKRLSHGMNPRGVCEKCGGEKMGTVTGQLAEICSNQFEGTTQSKQDKPDMTQSEAASDREAFEQAYGHHREFIEAGGKPIFEFTHVEKAHADGWNAALAHRDAQLGSEEMVETLKDALPIIKAYYGENGLFTKNFEAAIEAIRKGLRG